jgi:hypothetical protein
MITYTYVGHDDQSLCQRDPQDGRRGRGATMMEPTGMAGVMTSPSNCCVLH